MSVARRSVLRGAAVGAAGVGFTTVGAVPSLAQAAPASHSGPQLLSFGGEFNTPPGPLEQLYLQIVLERFDLLAHRGGRHMLGFGGICERQPRRHRFEDSQRVERQAGIGSSHVSFPYGRFR